ncbi:glycosyltransferase family 2 protein [Amphibacillus jilinensis]|uniref:glycosyltransferase family 2 protein n=1 Tax=Amphibacillus jilinensis TaxID=1216008 RepID=UPI0002D2B462|nr:glycosyltransferase family 2 protein [Amphibacillus jilinensis]
MDTRDEPKVSVITPTYNAARFIENTIVSVQQQSYQNWEMVIVDDQSTDDTVRVINKLMEQDQRIRLIELNTNQGPARARNVALKAAEGRYIAFLDSDDQWLVNKLEQQVLYMQQSNVAFTYTAYNRVQLHDDGRKEIKAVSVPSQVTYKQLLKQNVIGCLTVMIDVEKTGPVQMFDIRARQDYALWLELTRRGFEAHGINEVLANYSVRVGSLSSNKIKMAKQNWRVYREVEKLSLPVAIWYFIHYAFLKTKEYFSY